MKKTIGMLVACEIEAVLRKYGTPLREEKRGGFTVRLYDNDDYELAVLHSGIGEIAAAAGTELLIDGYGASFILNFGVVGGLTEEMAMAKTAVVTRIVHYDFDISEIDPVEPAQYPGYADIFIKAPEKYVELAMKTEPSLVPVSCASADKFIGDPERKKKLRELYGADICEMESAAVALTADRCGVPFLLIKTVSDGITGGAEEYEKEVLRSSEIALSVADRIMKGL